MSDDDMITGVSKRSLLKLMGAGMVGAAGSAALAVADSRSGGTMAQSGDSYDPFPVWDEAQSYSVTSSDGTQIHVEETGNEDVKPILFVHGGVQSWLAWDKQMFDGLRDGAEGSYEGLTEEFRLVAIDLRGRGLSDKPTDAYTPELFDDDVHAVIQARNLTDPLLVGWSYGGLVLLESTVPLSLFAVQSPSQCYHRVISSRHEPCH